MSSHLDGAEFVPCSRRAHPETLFLLIDHSSSLKIFLRGLYKKWKILGSNKEPICRKQMVLEPDGPGLKS